MNATNISVDQLKSNAKSATLAFAGIYVAAFDNANKFGDTVVAKAKTANTDFGKKADEFNTSGSKLFGQLVSRGEQVEADVKAAFDEVSLPKMGLPKVELPKIELPKIELPQSLSNIELPKSISDIKLPKVVSELKLPEALTELKLPEAVSDMFETVKSKVSSSK